MVEDTSVRDAASGTVSDADIISAWQADFQQQKLESSIGAKISLMLPTGKPIHVIRMPLVLLLQTGSIPDKLTHAVSKFINVIETTGGDGDKAAKSFEQEFTDDPIKAAQEWIELLNFVFCQCAISPVFVDTQEEAKPDHGIFWIGNVNFYDKLYVFQWAQGVDREVQAFLHEQIDALGTLPDEQGLRPTTEQLLASGQYGNVLASMADRPSDVDVGPVHSGEDRGDDRTSVSEEEDTDGTSPEVHVEGHHSDADGGPKPTSADFIKRRPAKRQQPLVSH